MLTSPPQITLGYAAVLGVVYAALALVVVLLRRKHNVPYGEGTSEQLLHAIRAHGNFAEWVPFVSLLVAALEMTGKPPVYIHVLMGALLFARILHPIGLFSAVGTPTYFVGRISGALTTWLVLVAASLLALPVLA